MLYTQFKECRLSSLGFGTMRLPLLPDGKTIDNELTAKMIDYAIANGVNYFDTAFPYHSGYSELVVGDVLSNYPRDSFFLADKYPGHQHTSSFNPEETFELQLRKCKVDYFDFYLLHNVCENSIGNYTDDRWNMVDYFVKQKEKGRILHLGFSSHAEPDLLESFLDSRYGKPMEFCQIQLNYLDWTLQDARRKCRILNERDIPIWVMEPVRGGKLAVLPDSARKRLKEFRPDDSTVSWAFRWLQGIPGVKMILSGMSDMSQMVDNVNTFNSEKPLSQEEQDLLYSVAGSLYSGVPCTACRYCCDVCPQGLDIPAFMRTYSDLSLESSFTPVMRIEALPEDKRPSACLACGSCREMCPQGINIPEIISSLDERIASLPSWSSICRTREEEARRLAGK